MPSEQHLVGVHGAAILVLINKLDKEREAGGTGKKPAHE